MPIAIKDFTPTKGKTTTLGSKVYRDWVPDEDAQIVKDLTGAGAIMVGKTTTPEFAHAGFTHSPLWGVTRNPWNPERTPGGRPAAPARRSPRAACRWPRAPTWAGRCASRPRSAAPWA